MSSAVPTPCANKVHMQPKENQLFFAFNISSVIDVWTGKINKYVYLFIFRKIKFMYVWIRLSHHQDHRQSEGYIALQTLPEF